MDKEAVIIALGKYKRYYMQLYSELDKDIEIVYNFFDRAHNHVVEEQDPKTVLFLIHKALRAHVERRWPNTLDEFDGLFFTDTKEDL